MGSTSWRRLSPTTSSSPCHRKFLLVLTTVAWCTLLAVTPSQAHPSSGTGAPLECPPQNIILPCRCLIRDGETQIWCSHSDLPHVLDGLRAVGQYVTHPIDELILENNNLPSLPGKTFLTLRVMRLMLRNNGLQRVSSGWLTGLENTLMELFVVEPELRSLPEDSLQHMDALEAITIKSGLMKRTPSFSGLQKLRYMQIDSLSLVELSPRHFNAMPALRKLHISGSPRLSRLEAGLLHDLPNLQLVNISYCDITWIHPRAITRLPSLTELSLEGNRIADAGMIGRGARELPTLEVIRLDKNYIEVLAEASFVDLPALKKLYLTNNKITELQHGAFHRVPNLRTLDLTHNLLRRIHPESFLQSSGSGLEELWLVDNAISHVGELRSLLDALPRLTFLEMSRNNLEAIPFGALRGHPTLERLHLDHNKIHLVDREAFTAMPALRELRLKNNSLNDMLDGPLWNLPALKGLDLSENYFRRLEPRLLVNLPSLRKVDLSGNELTMIDPGTFRGTPALENVNLSYNALSSLHPATFRHLLGLYELDVSSNRLLEFVPGLPRGVEYLHMAKNQITTIPLHPSPDLDLPSLRMLDVSSNGIQKIFPGSLTTLPQLRKLLISKNALQQLEDGALEGLTRLEVLDLDENRILMMHINALRNMPDLRELRLRSNRLDILRPELFRAIPHLKKLDISRNLLTEIIPGTFERNRDIQTIDASHNSLQELPESLYGLKNLRVLALNNNKLNNIHPKVLNSLASLTEFKLSHNLLQELRDGAFENMRFLRELNLDNNELANIESNAVHSLPELKTLKLNQNNLKDIPESAFSDLPSLQVVELQDNELRNIANDAFISVPHLLSLNLSNNQLTGVEDAGLRSMRSLEMLDLSSNKIGRVQGPSLEKMEWLVELRMDDNKICAVQGSPFTEMPRLRVLSMRNNRMMSLSESAVQTLRSNIAVLDIDGNPLACTCNLLWLRGWLQEASAVGPRCVDGTYVREMRLSRQECMQEYRQLEPVPVAPGCEAELLTAPGNYGTSQVLAQWMNLKDNSTTAGKHAAGGLAPSPEESDYFYDEYVDYPYNETVVMDPNNNLYGNVGSNLKQHSSTTDQTAVYDGEKSSHYINGDTPTIYAATNRNKTQYPDNVQKTASSSPGSSGFTFFGVPLPNLNLNKLIGSVANGAKNVVRQAERKSAIVNSGPRRTAPMYPPSMPNVQTGGFQPMLPGEGGFQPMVYPNINQQQERPNNYNYTVEKVQVANFTPPAISTEASVLSSLTVPQTTEPYMLRPDSFPNMGHPMSTPPPDSSEITPYGVYKIEPSAPTTTYITEIETGGQNNHKGFAYEEHFNNNDKPNESFHMHSITTTERYNSRSPTMATMNDLNMGTSTSPAYGNTFVEEARVHEVKKNNLHTDFDPLSDVSIDTSRNSDKGTATAAAAAADTETAAGTDSFEDVFKGMIANASIHQTRKPKLNLTELASFSDQILPEIPPSPFFTAMTPPNAAAADTSTTSNNRNDDKTQQNDDKWVSLNNRNKHKDDQSRPQPGTLSTLLVPGGQVEQPRSGGYKPSGRPVITKVPAPGSEPLQADLEISLDEPIPLYHQGSSNEEQPVPPPSKKANGTRSKDKLDWYFVNYNKTNLEPYVGPEAKRTPSGNIFVKNQMSQTKPVFLVLVVVSLLHHQL